MRVEVSPFGVLNILDAVEQYLPSSEVKYFRLEALFKGSEKLSISMTLPGARWTSRPFDGLGHVSKVELSEDRRQDQLGRGSDHLLPGPDWPVLVEICNMLHSDSRVDGARSANSIDSCERKLALSSRSNASQMAWLGRRR